MRALLFAVAAAAAASLACAHLVGQQSKDKTLCPESEGQVCLTAPSCTLDEARGCRVCQCSPGQPEQGRPENYGRPDTPRDRNQP